MHTMTIRAFGLALLLSAPVLTWAAPDAETLRLEAAAFCQAMPWTCPQGPPPPPAAETTPAARPRPRTPKASRQARPATVKAVPAPVAVQTLEETCHAMYPTQPDLEDACLQRWTVGGQMSGSTHPTDPPHGTGLTPEEVIANCAGWVGVGSREFAACLDRWTPVMTARPPSAAKTPPTALHAAIDTLVYGCAHAVGMPIDHTPITWDQVKRLAECIDLVMHR